MSVRGTQSVLNLLASYEFANASPLAERAPLSFAAARLEREQARLARRAEAEAEEIDQSGGRDVGWPRLRVKPPLSSGEITYSPTVPGSPKMVSPPNSLSHLDHSANSEPLHSASSLPSTVPKQDEKPSPTRPADQPLTSSIAEIPPFNSARSRPSSPTPSATSARSQSSVTSNVQVPMDLMARLRQKQRAAHDSHVATPPPSVEPATNNLVNRIPTSDTPSIHTVTSERAPSIGGVRGDQAVSHLRRTGELDQVALPPSPALVPTSSPESSGPVPLPSPISERNSLSTRPTSSSRPGVKHLAGLDEAAEDDESEQPTTSEYQRAREAHEFHAVSPITERTEIATLSSARRSYNLSQSGAPSFRSSVGTFPSHRWSVQTDPRPASVLDSIRERSTSSISAHNTDPDPSRYPPSLTATPPDPSRPSTSDRTAGRTSPRKPSPELAKRTALFSGSIRGSPEAISSSATGSSRTPPRSPSKTGVLSQRVDRSVARSLVSGGAPVEPPVIGKPAEVPAGWAALKREMEEEKRRAQVKVTSVSTRTSDDRPGVSSSREPSRTSFVLSDREPSEAGVEPEFHSAKGSPADEGAILFEGPLFVPPSSALSATEALALPVSDWRERYVVLATEALEARPTDRAGLRQPEVILHVDECLRVVNVDRPGVGLRAFAVQLAGGGTRVFATETRTKRANWVLELGNVIAAPRSGTETAGSSCRSATTSSSPLARSPRKQTPVSSYDRDAFSPPPQAGFVPTSHLFSSTATRSQRPPLATRKTDVTQGPPATLTTPRGAGRSERTRETAESSLFGAAGEFPPRTLWPGEVAASAAGGEDVWEQLAQSVEARVRGGPAKDLFGHLRQRAEPVAGGSVAASTEGRGVGDASERPRPPPLASHRSSVPAGVIRDLAETIGAITSPLSQELAHRHPQTLASKVYFLIKAILSKISLDNGQLVGASITPGVGELEWLEDLLAPRLSVLVTADQARRDPGLIRAAIVNTLDVLQGVMRRLEQASQPLHSPRPQRVVDVDQLTEATSRMADHADEAESWRELRRSYETEAAAARAQAPPSPRASPTTRAKDVRYAERKLSGKIPNAPSTVEGHLPYPPDQVGRQALEPIASDGGWEAEASPSQQGDVRSERTWRGGASQGGRGPLPRAPPEAGCGQDEWAGMGHGSRWMEGESLVGSVVGAKAASLTTEDKLRTYRRMSQGQLLAMLVLNNEKQTKWMEASDHHQRQMDSFFKGLTEFLAEGRARSDGQHEQLLGALQGALARLGPELTENLTEDVYRRMHDLPSRAEEAELRGQEEAGGAGDVGGGERAEETDGDTVVGSDPGEDGAGGGGGGDGSKRGPGLAGFAEVERRMAGGPKLKKAWSRANAVKGPRGIKLWGIGGSAGGGTSNWAAAIASRPPRPAPPPPPPPKQEGQSDEDYNMLVQRHINEVEAAKAKAHEPLIDKIRSDEGLAQTLETLANGEGEIDAGSMALAVFEILQSMRDVHKRQAQKEAAEAEERSANGGLSRKEVALLEMKKQELARLEALTDAEHHTTTKLDTLAAALDQKQAAQDTILAQIASEVRAEKEKGMDPALVAEGKVLLEKVKSGVDGHIRDFRGQLTGEVQRMFKEVGKLREEKQSLQREIADLMAFHAKQGGTGGGGGGGGGGGAAKGQAKQVKKSAPVEAAAPAIAGAGPKSPRPGPAVGGWFGPRAPK